MKTIWKYKLETTGTQSLSLPTGYKILTVQMQDLQVCLWVLVDSEEKKKAILIDIFGTGHYISNVKRNYIGTYQLKGGALVFHVFERI